MQTPLLQVQLTPGLECRAYPKYYDSMVGTRLVVARTDRSWIWDEITEVISLTPRVKEYGCRLDPDGQVRFWYVEEQEYKEVVRKLE